VVFMTGAFEVVLMFAEPTTCNACLGVVVPMQTLAELAVVTLNQSKMLAHLFLFVRFAVIAEVTK